MRTRIVGRHDPLTASDLPAPTLTLATMKDGEVLLVWALRRWLAAQRQREVVEAVLAPPFKLAGMTDGPSLVDDFLTRIAATAKRPITIHCVLCNAVSHDEARLLCVLRLLQNDQVDCALDALSEIVPRGAGRMLVRVGQLLAGRVDAAGLGIEREAKLGLVGTE
jgi:hypothetical protein